MSSAGPDVGADRPRLLGQLVEQVGVDVVADAEGEDARVGACSWPATFLRILSGLVSPMVGWPSVKKTTVNGPAIVRLGPQVQRGRPGRR